MPPRRTSEELLHLFKENWPEGYSPAEEVMLRLYHAALRHTEELQRFLARFELTMAEFVTLRVKDAVCDVFRDAQGRRPAHF